MNAHATALPAVQGAESLDALSISISDIVTDFLETIAGTTYEVHQVCNHNHLSKMVAVLESQIPQIEELTKYIHSKREIACGHYFGEGIISEGEKAVNCLRLMIDELKKNDQSMDFGPEIDAHQSGQVHAIHKRAITLAQRAITAIETSNGAIVTLDLDAEPPPTRTWDNLDDMLAALKAQPA